MRYFEGGGESLYMLQNSFEHDSIIFVNSNLTMFNTASSQQVGSIFLPISEEIVTQIRADTVYIHSAFWLNKNVDEEVYLTFTNNYIALCYKGSFDYQYCYYTPIHFDLKFQVLYQANNQGNPTNSSIFSKPLGFKLVKKNAENLEFMIVDERLMGVWMSTLSKHINQLGFHQMFKPVKKLGKGGFATVYQVQRVTDGRKFAVKAFSKINTINSTNPSHRLTFLNQIKMMRSVDHPNVIKLEGVFQSDNSLYVVLEQLSGGQMHSKINTRSGKFTQKEIKEFMRGMAKGLKELHQNNIMHRDIKPENIMLRDSQSLDPVIVDFGLSADVTTDDYIFYRCGTPGYVAPEVITLNKGQKISPICDIFSVGAIFHIMLMARPLFAGTKFQEVYENNRKLNFNLRSQEYAHVDRQAIDLLQKMLKVNPKQRLSADGVLKHPYLAKQAMLDEKLESMSPITMAAKNRRNVKVF